MPPRRPHPAASRRRPAALVLAVAALAACVSPGGAPPSPDATPAEPALVGEPRQLTFEGTRSGEGYFSRDGERLVFQSEREPGNPFYQIYLMSLVDGTVTRVSPGVGKTTCGFIHPSGNRVLFASTHLDPQSETLQRVEIAGRSHAKTGRRYAWDYDPHYDLFSARIPGDRAPGEPLDATAVSAPGRGDAGRGLDRLTSAPGYDAEASWSPDGRQIVFASNRHVYAPDGGVASWLTDDERERLEVDPSYFVDLYVMDARGGNVRRLTIEPGYDGGPFFSPDGKRIVFRRFGEDGATAEIFTMNTDGSDVVQLTHLGALSWAPFYHPSGDYVIFSTNLHGFDDFELYLVRADGRGEPVRATEDAGFDGLPAFSPAGDELVYTRKPPGGTSQLWIATWDDAVARAKLSLPKDSVPGVGPMLPVPTRLSPEIDEDDLRVFVDALSSDAASGRLTGTPGERIATSYVARTFRALGLEPAGDDDGYFQEFGFTAGVSAGAANELVAKDADGAPILAAPDETELRIDRDYRPLAFSRTGGIPASGVVFAGYGVVAPAGETDAGDPIPAVDDYAGLDVADRWVIVLRNLPHELSPDERRHYSRHASLRYKAMVARDRGARGVLFASGPRGDVRDELVALRSDASLGGTSVAVVSVTDATADALLAAGGHDGLATLQDRLDRRKPLPGFALDGVSVAANVDIRQQRKVGRNVLARLPAARPQDPPLPVLLVGAHVDHIGSGESGNSLAKSDEKHEIHRGADDNASGVAALLEIAGAMAAERERGGLESVRDVVFAAWSGEELGLLGSTAYAEELGRTLGKDELLSARIAAYLNMDMIGRLRDVLSLFGVDSSPIWPREIERRNVRIGLRINPLGDSYVPSDATTFYLRGVPALTAFTGAHDEYHTPRDVSELLDYEGLADVARLVRGIAASVASTDTAPVYVEQPAPPNAGERAGLRVYLGTIPDYTAGDGSDGLALSGVAKNGPAERAGLRAGDVIVRVDGRAVENIYDYTYALDGLAVGEAVEIVVRRDGRERSFTVTPASRD